MRPLTIKYWIIRCKKIQKFFVVKGFDIKVFTQENLDLKIFLNLN